MRRAEGAYIELEDGRRILDAISSWWVNLHGHAHPAIAEAISRQARTMEHVIFAGFTHAPAEELVARLRKILPAPLLHVFFSDDGSTAVEVALKLAVQYWRNAGRPEKCRIVALEHAYHGDTLGAMSVSDDSPFTAAFAPLRLPVLRAHSAYCYRCPVGKQRATCHIECLDSLRGLLEQHGAEIAAVIVEPLLQGAGGMIVHPEEFLAGVRELTARTQRAFDRRRSPHRIRTHGPDVRVRARRRRAGFDVRLERNYRAGFFRSLRRLGPRKSSTRFAAPIARALFSTDIPTPAIPSPAPRPMPAWKFSIPSRYLKASPRSKRFMPSALRN